MKTCTKCGIEKDESEFYKNRGHKDGFASQCKKCNAELKHRHYHLTKVLKEKVQCSLGMKICSKCKIEKMVEEFCKNKRSRDGLNNVCKECEIFRVKQYGLDNKEKILAYQEQYREKNKDVIAKYRRQCYQKNKELYSKRAEQYYRLHKSEVIEYQKEYYQEHKEKILEYQKKYNKESKEKIKKRKCRWYKEYYRKNKEEISERQRCYFQINEHRESRAKYRREWSRNRRIADPCFRLRKNISWSIARALKYAGGCKRGTSCLQFLPYTIQQLKEHLESQFDCYMSWENHGMCDLNRYTWQIDHIVPHSSFHYESMDCEEFRQCWALENLRPLRAIDNVRKGNRK